MIPAALAKQLQAAALSAPLSTPGDPIRAALPPDRQTGIAVLVSVNH